MVSAAQIDRRVVAGKAKDSRSRCGVGARDQESRKIGSSWNVDGYRARQTAGRGRRQRQKPIRDRQNCGIDEDRPDRTRKGFGRYASSNLRKLLSIIRRWAFRNQLSIREISWRTRLSRNTIRKYLRSGSVKPEFKVPDRPSKLDAFAEQLSDWFSTRHRERRPPSASMTAPDLEPHEGVGRSRQASLEQEYDRSSLGRRLREIVCRSLFHGAKSNSRSQGSRIRLCIRLPEGSV